MWTNRDTFSAADLPHRTVVLGGGPVAVETAVFLARFGVQVVVALLVQHFVLTNW